MAERFRWTRRGYVADLERTEVRLLRGLVRDVVTLLENRQDEVREDAAPAGGAAGAPTPSTPGDPGRPAASDAGPAAGIAEDDAAFWTLVDGLELRPHGDGRRTAPEDAAVARLLPDSLPEAEPAERDRQRALTEDPLIVAKLADARRALAALGSTRIVLPHEHAASFGRALNDVRLVLAARLGVESDEDARRVHAVDDWRRAQDVESTMALLYNFTTWLLETLMEEMLAALPEAEDDTQDEPGADAPEGGSRA